MEPAIDNTNDCKDDELDATFFASSRGVECWHYRCDEGDFHGIDNIAYGSEDE